MQLIIVIGIIGFIYRVIKENIDSPKAHAQAQKWAEGMHFESLADMHKRLDSLTNFKEDK